MMIFLIKIVSRKQVGVLWVDVSPEIKDVWLHEKKKFFFYFFYFFRLSGHAQDTHTGYTQFLNNLNLLSSALWRMFLQNREVCLGGM